jgi:hypothetical protein
VFVSLERTARKLVVRRHGRRDHDRFDRLVREDVIDVHRQPRVRVTLGQLAVLLLVDVAEPGKLREVIEVAREVLAPPAEADLP